MAIYDYRTEALTDFGNPTNLKAYEEGLKIARSYLGEEFPLIINGERIYTDTHIKSLNPSNHQEVLGDVCQASMKEAELAMDAALTTFEFWKKVDPRVRADVLFKAANIMKRRKHELSALMTLKAGKPWVEADADTAEAIDFLEYYGRQMLKISRIDDTVLSRRDIERNEYVYIPLGVGAIIAPWNFPLAILTGYDQRCSRSWQHCLVKNSVYYINNCL